MLYNLLLKKNSAYVQDFNEIIRLTSEIGRLTRDLYSGESPDKSILLNIRSLETRCTNFSLELLNKLYKNFITPFDNHEMEAAANSIVKISDMLIYASERAEIFGIRGKVKYADRLLYIVADQLDILSGIILDLGAIRTADCERVRELGDTVHTLFQLALRDLFANEKSASEIIKQKEILEFIKKASDQCQTTVDLFEHYFYNYI